MTVYIIHERNPDLIERLDNVIMIDKLENGHLVLLFQDNKDGILEMVIEDAITCEVME